MCEKEAEAYVQTSGRPEKSLRSAELELQGSCDPSDTNVGSLACVFWKNREHFQLLTHLSGPMSYTLSLRVTWATLHKVLSQKINKSTKSPKQKC